MHARLLTGLVIGKFLPPHLGHRYLINFAQEYVQDLYILIRTDDKDSIPLAFRKAWMETLYPRARVIEIEKQEAKSLDKIRQTIGTQIDYVFASEEYGNSLAQGLNALFIPVDINRDLFPVSSSAICKAPHQHWDYLPDCVKPYFLKKVCLYGPMQSGKTELAQQLAASFNTYYVGEFVKTKGYHYQDLSVEQFVEIARSQLAAESALSPFANKILFCDTNVILLKVHCELIHGVVPEELLQLCEQSIYHLTLVPNIIKANADSLQMMRSCVMELEQRAIKYHALNGSMPKRLNKALRTVRMSFPSLQSKDEDHADFVLLGNR